MSAGGTGLQARLQAWAHGLLIAVLSLALLWVFWRGLQLVRTAVHALVIGAVLAFLLEPVARLLDRLFRNRLASALLLLALILAGVGVAGGYLGVAAFHEAESLAATLPDLINRAQRELPSWLAFIQQWTGSLDLTSLGQTLLSRFESVGKGALTYSFSLVAATTETVTVIIVAIVIAFYFILDGRRMRAGWYALLPLAWRPAMDVVEGITARTLGGYVRGQLLVSATFGLLVGGGMWALGLPYPLLLALQAALFELLPTVGPVLSAVAPAVLALGLPMPKVWYVLLYFLVAQQIESNLLVPRITGQTVGLHPVVVILAILGGFDVAGVAGALSAVPVVAAVYAVGRHFLAENGRTSGRSRGRGGGRPRATPAPPAPPPPPGPGAR